MRANIMAMEILQRVSERMQKAWPTALSREEEVRAIGVGVTVQAVRDTGQLAACCDDGKELFS